MSFGRGVRSHREALSISQERLAEIAALDRTYISGIERGVRNPTLLTVARIAKALHCSVNDLTDGLEH